MFVGGSVANNIGVTACRKFCWLEVHLVSLDVKGGSDLLLS